MGAEFWVGLACVGLGLLCLALVALMALQARHRLHPLKLVVLAAFSMALLLGGLCVAGGAVIDRDVPSIEESLRPTATAPRR